MALLLMLFGGFTYFIRPEGGSAPVELYDPGKPTIFTSMFDAKTLFHSKTTAELYFSLLIFKLCSLDWVISLAPKLISWAESSGMEQILYWCVKQTFYKQFCAGETLEEAQRTIQKLNKEGVFTILDYSTEEAINAAAWDSNMRNVLKLLTQAQEHLPPVKFVPLKVTSLMPPHLLERLTELLRYQSEHPSEGGALNREWNPKPSSAPVKSFPPGYDPNKSPAPLSPEELKLLNDALTRLSTICEAAQKAKIRLLIDAEQTFRQPAIDYLALYLSRKFNKTEPLVFNTYQMYLKNTKNVLQDHLATAFQEDFFLACKVVRGAYLITETDRANKLGYDNLIYPTKMNTDDSYDKAVSTILEKMARQKVAVVVATHNVESVMLACQKARELKIPSNHSNLYFGQLKGMSDQLTYGLAYTKFNACKLLPYGPVSNVIPYLVRRLQENRDIMGGTQVERQLMWSELKRRNFGLSK